MSKRDRQDALGRQKLVDGALAAFRRDVEDWMPQPRERSLRCPWCAQTVTLPAGSALPRECPVCGQSWAVNDE